MKTLMALIPFFLFLSVANAKQYEVLKKQSQIQWKGTKLLGEGHWGTVKVKEGKLEIEGSDLKGGYVVIDMNSIKCTDIKDPGKAKKLENHLKDPDFFEVNLYPTAKITLNDVTLGKGGDYEVSAKLKIKGKSEPIQFTAREEKGGYTAKIKFDRTKFGVTYNSINLVKVAKDRIINNEIEIDVFLKVKK